MSDVNEIIQKYMTQQSTHNRLLAQTQEQEAHLEQLQVEYRKSKHQLEDMKFSSTSPIRQQLTGEASDAVAEDSALRLERNKTRFEKLAKVLVEMNAGVSHLHAKLAPIKLEGRSTAEVTHVSEETIEDVLNVCELKIVRLIELVGETPVSDEIVANATGPRDIRIKLPDPKADEVDFDDSQENDAVFSRSSIKKTSQQLIEKARKYVV